MAGSVIKQSHPHHPELIYRYEGPMGLVGYARTKKSAQRALSNIQNRYGNYRHTAEFKIGKGAMNAKS